MLTEILAVSLLSFAPAPAVQEPAPKPAPRAPIFDEQADGCAQIAAALARAKSENRRVLVEWGANW